LFNQKDFSAEAAPFLKVATTKKGPKRPMPVKVLVCGWRTEWDTEPKRIYDRILVSKKDEKKK
jgi:hypothetical protein